MPMHVLARAAIAAAIFLPAISAAHEDNDSGVVLDQNGLAPIQASSHAPIGVMGDHLHGAGEWMLSYRFMSMTMEGNRDGTSDLTPEQIVTGQPNRFFGTPGQPATLRIVPLEMRMQMHMLGGMYAPTDWLTLMAMANVVEKDMDHVTFAGGAGVNRLGNFTTRTSGLGDTRLVTMWRLYESENHQLQGNLGLSLPTGSIKETGVILAPNGTRPTVRLPYAMQLGSGTYDLLPALGYTGQDGAIGWGAQYSGIIRTGTNSQGYTLGDQHALTAWASYQWMPEISTSFRLAGTTLGSIDGIDSNIIGPVQTADPDNYGGDWAEAFIGVNLAGQSGILRGQRLALELGMPVYQDLNGPQMKRQWSLALGWQVAF